jgi:hypothetical protein
MFESLKQREFFGKVTVEFNRGQAKLVRIEETTLIQEENRNEHYSRSHCR